MGNRLYYGDNLDILRRYIPNDSVDLIYLDPPFNSQADYNILFKEHTGKPSEAQITAFEDTWHWTEETERTFQEIIDTAPAHVIEMIRAFRQFTGNNDMMAYLTMMCVRLIELHRVLKPTGSIYLHCDPTASHYLKILMDTIFGKKNFRTEISWKRSSAHSDAKQGRKQYGNIRDIILFYSKSDKWIWNWLYTSYDETYVNSFYKHKEPETGRRFRLDNLTAAKPGGDVSYDFHGTKPYKGRYWAYSRENMEKFLAEGRLYFPKNGGTPSYKRYLDEMPGVPLQNNWDDLKPPMGTEYLDYPTQKPTALLERIIQASSNEGDIILDPFCGCGTTITAAQKTKRKWIGIDVTHLAINLIKWRMKHMFDLEPKKDYAVIGEPEDLTGAMELASQNRYQFQWWALSLIDARPYGDKKKGKDTGIDGFVYFTEEKDSIAKGIVSVKSGKVSVKDIRDLGHVMDREKAEIAVFITLQPLTRDMITEAVSKGFYKSKILHRDFSRIQVLTIEDLLNGKKPDIPYQVSAVKKAERADTSEKLRLNFEGE